MGTFCVEPSFARNEVRDVSIADVIAAHTHYLPHYGWEEVHDPASADLRVGHVGATIAPLDIFHFHGMYPTAEHEGTSMSYYAANTGLVRNLRRAGHVVAPSEWTADLLRRDMHLSPSVVGHGIDLDYWGRVEPMGIDCAPYALWNKTRSSIVCDPMPFITLAKRNPDFHFVTTFASGHPSNVRVTGKCPAAEAHSWIKGAAVYVATTRETFGISLLEAMVSGVPIIGYDWGAAPSIVGNAGIFVQPGDEDALDEAFHEALDRQNELGQKGQQRVKKYEWPLLVERLAAVYDSVLGELTASRPRVTVVIPCFNYAQYVESAIWSVIDQTFADWELFVVDDGSTDNSREVIEAAIANEPRAHYVHQDNAGVANARNNGIAHGSGEFVVCLDADDEMGNGYLETCVRALKADRSLGIAYTALSLMLSDGQVRHGAHSFPQQYDARRGVAGNQIPTCCLFHRSAWERTGGYRQRHAPHGAGQEDGDLWLRILSLGFGAQMVTEEPLFYYRLHSRSATRTHPEDWRENTYNAWHPFVKDGQHPLASQLGVPPHGSWPVRNYDCPSIGVVIPVGPYHVEALRDALDSVEAQTFRYWECVVVNDTGQPLNLAAWPWARVIDIEGEQGPGYARNVGTAALKAPLVTYLDADNWFRPDALWEFLHAYTGLWIYPDKYVLRDGSLEYSHSRDWDLDDLWRRETAGITCLYPVEFWREVGGFDEEVLREDWDFHLRLAAAGYCGEHLSKALFVDHPVAGQRRDSWRDPQHHRDEVAYLQEKYPLEELEMACRGCGKKSQRVKVRQQPEPSPPTNWTTKEEAGFMRMEFTGKNENDLVFRGKRTGRRYIFGNNPYRRFGFVHPDDVEGFKRMGFFKEVPPVVQQPVAVEPVVEPKIEPVEPVKLAAEPVEPDQGNGSIDVGTLRVEDIFELDLSHEQWVDVLEQEQERDRPRISVVKYAGRRIRATGG